MVHRKSELSPALFWGFVVLMLGLLASFVALGNWQVQRLAEKEELVALVAERLQLPAEPAPPAAEWPGLTVADINFRPLTLTGTFVSDQTVRVFTSLAAGSARGPASGPGYWIVTPFVLESGGTVFVNRGFVPAAAGATFDPPPARRTTIEGLAREDEARGSFTPQPNVQDRIEWVRSVDRLAAFVPPELSPFAPFTLDQAAGPAGLFPQGGETIVEFPNNHLGYALTWYGFALITPVLLGFWVWRQRRV